MNNLNYIKRIKDLGNSKDYLLEDIRTKVAYPGTLSCFRVLCWRHNIPFAKGYRGDSAQVARLKNEGFDFSNLNLSEIKKELDYKGGLDGLAGLLKRHEVAFKKQSDVAAPDRTLILALISNLGDTTSKTPKEILTAIGVDIVNPAQYLRRLNVPYKAKTSK